MSSRRRSSRRTTAKSSPAQPPETSGSKSSDSRRPTTRRRLIGLLVVLLGLVAVVAVRFLADYWFDSGVAALRIHRFELADQQLRRAETWSRRGGEVALLRCRVGWVKGDPDVTESQLLAAADQGCDPKRIEQERSLIQIRSGLSGAMRWRLPSMLQNSPEDGPAILEAFTAGFLARGDPDQAAEMLAIWENADAEDARIYYWRGMLEQTFGKLADAIPHFERSLEIAPDMTPARLALADILKSHFFFSEALPHYQQIVRLQPGIADAEVGLGICLLGSKLADQGERQLKAAVAAFPTNAPARLALGEYYQDQHEPQKVVAFVEPLIGEHANELTLNYLLATAYKRLGENERSDEYFDTYQRMSWQLATTQVLAKKHESQPSAELARQIASSFMQCKWEDAGTWILTALSSDPKNVEMNQMMAEFLRRSGRAAVARAYEENAKTLSLRKQNPPKPDNSQD